MRELHVPLEAFQRRPSIGCRANVGDQPDQVTLGGVHASDRFEGAVVRAIRAARPVHRSLFHSAVISKLVALATILMVATGCDKAKEFVRAGQTAGPCLLYTSPSPRD